MTDGTAVQRDRPDWRWIAVASVGLMVVTSLPLIVGLLHQTPQLRYLGFRDQVPYDYAVYTSWIRQSAEGEWLLSNRFSSELGGWGILNTYWVAVGKLAALLHLTPVVAFHLARLASIPLLLLALDWLLRLLLPVRQERRLTFTLVAVGNGLGLPLLAAWLLTTPPGHKLSIPMDLWAAFGAFNAAAHSGHVVLALALLLAGFAAWLRALETRAWRWVVVSGLCGLGYFSFHPFEVALVAPILAVTTLWWGWRQQCLVPVVARLAVWAVLVSPPVLYQLAAVLLDPVTAGRGQQNLLLQHPLYAFALSLGLPLAAGAVGWVQRLRSGDRSVAALLVLVWLPLQLALSFAPLPFQRKLTIGLLVPASVLAAPVLLRIWHRAAADWQRAALAAGAAALLLPSSVFIIAHGMVVVAQRGPDHYRTVDELAAFTWLAERTPSSAVVLADRRNANLIPAWAGRTTVVGHGVESVRSAARLATVGAYFRNQRSLAQRQALYRRERVSYVWVGPDERALGFAPGPELVVDYANRLVTLYRVLP